MHLYRDISGTDCANIAWTAVKKYAGFRIVAVGKRVRAKADILLLL